MGHRCLFALVAIGVLPETTSSSATFDIFPSRTVVAGSVRFTVLTEAMVRMEKTHNRGKMQWDGVFRCALHSVMCVHDFTTSMLLGSIRFMYAPWYPLILAGDVATYTLAFAYHFRTCACSCIADAMFFASVWQACTRICFEPPSPSAVLVYIPVIEYLSVNAYATRVH